MRQVVTLMTVLCALVLWTGIGARATEYPIKFVLENSKILHNKVVTVRGLVSNERVLTTTDPFNDNKGEFDLTDPSGTIHVLTKGKCPVNGTKLKMNGMVVDAELGPYLVFKPSIPILYIALGILVVLAIVLVIVLLRPSTPPPPPVPQYVPPVSQPEPQPAIQGRLCPKCQTLNEVDAKFCQSCGETMQTTQVPNDDRTREFRILALLTVVSGDQVGSTFEMLDKDKRYKLGRNAEFRLNDNTVSREHAALWWQDGKFFLQDEGSTHGTLINGQAVTRQTLADGDEIQLGKVKMKFTITSSDLAVV